MSERFARAAQHALAVAHRCDGSTCPDEDTLIAFADGRLPEERRDEVAARVAACAICAAAVRAALDVAAWATDVAADMQRSDTAAIRTPIIVARPRRNAWLPLAMAASLAALVGVGVLMRPPLVDESLRGNAVVATTPVDGAVLRNAPDRLAWPCDAAPRADRVELLAADAMPLWSGAVESCAVKLPASTRATLQPGQYLWRVQDAAGEDLIGPFAFRIAP